MELDDLIRDMLAAPDDASRAAAAARLFAVPDVLSLIARKLTSTDWRRRQLGLHVVTRCSPAPALFAEGVIFCLRAPLDPDPLGEETALLLVCCGALAAEITGFRDVLAERVAAIDRAEGERAPVMRRLAHETLAKVDAEVLEDARRWKREVATVVDLLRAGRPEEAETIVEQGSATMYYPELGRAARWEAAGDLFVTGERKDLARWCYERAHDAFAEHASGASAGGEGLARMIDVDRLAAKLGH